MGQTTLDKSAKELAEQGGQTAPGPCVEYDEYYCGRCFNGLALEKGSSHAPVKFNCPKCGICNWIPKGYDWGAKDKARDALVEAAVDRGLIIMADNGCSHEDVVYVAMRGAQFRKWNEARHAYRRALSGEKEKEITTPVGGVCGCGVVSMPPKYKTVQTAFNDLQYSGLCPVVHKINPEWTARMLELIHAKVIGNYVPSPSGSVAPQSLTPAARRVLDAVKGWYHARCSITELALSKAWEAYDVEQDKSPEVSKARGEMSGRDQHGRHPSDVCGEKGGA